MKLTKSQLQNLIKEEINNIKEGDDDWYSDEHETLADKKFADDEGVFPVGLRPAFEDLVKKEVIAYWDENDNLVNKDGSPYEGVLTTSKAGPEERGL
jgi:hypothetical protein